MINSNFKLKKKMHIFFCSWWCLFIKLYLYIHAKLYKSRITNISFILWKKLNKIFTSYLWHVYCSWIQFLYSNSKNTRWSFTCIKKVIHTSRKNYTFIRIFMIKKNRCASLLRHFIMHRKSLYKYCPSFILKFIYSPH